MRTLRRGLRGEDVRLLQARLGGLKADGSFGPATVARLKQVQGILRLVQDGSCGPATQRALGFMPTKYSNLYVIRIPFSEIESANVLLHDAGNRSTIDKYAKESPGSMIVNAGFFDMRTGQNTTDLIVNGILNNGGNYTNKGLRFEGSRITYSTTAQCNGVRGVDFMGGCPSLIVNGVKNVDMKGIANSIYTGNRQRMAYGFSSDAFYIITTLQGKTASLQTVLNEGLHQGLKFLMAGDGGGSVAVSLNDALVCSAGRPVPTTLALKLSKRYRFC